MTEYLSAQDAKIYGQAMANLRKVEKILKEMRSLSRKILDDDTGRKQKAEPAKRKARKNTKSTLS